MILSNLVWLFPAYREAIDEIHRLQQVNAALVFQLEHQSTRDINAMMIDFQEKILTDQPFPEGKVPDHFWLSPIDEPTRG